MDDEDIRHWQKLILEHKRYLRVLEEQAAGYGKLACPPHVVTGVVVYYLFQLGLISIETAVRLIGGLSISGFVLLMGSLIFILDTILPDHNMKFLSAQLKWVRQKTQLLNQELEEKRNELSKIYKLNE